MRLPLATVSLILATLSIVPAPAKAAESVSGTVSSVAESAALPGAAVEIPSLGIQAITDDRGHYVLPYPPEAKGTTVEVRASLPPFQPATRQVTLDAGAVADFALALSYFETITVGSRAAGAAAEKAVPVDILPARAIETAGAAETNQIIEALAPSFNFPRPTITDGTDSVRPATLRGLGSDQVLVLVNGKRRHTSALVHVNGSIGRGSTGVDLNAIPASMIESIEILKDGAAAQYGSDAIAGVINVKLKEGAKPLNLDLRAGATTHSDGDLLDTSLNQGWTLGRGTLFATVEYRDRGETNRAGPDPRPQGARDPVPQPNHHWGDSKAKDLMAFFNGSTPVNDAGTASFYVFGGASRRKGSHGGFFRRALQNQNWPQIYPNGFLPLIEPKVTDLSLTGGVRGAAGAWFWDGSLDYGNNEFEFHVSDSLNTSLGPNIPPNQTSFFAGSLDADQLVANLDLSRTFDVGLAGPLNVALGAEARRDGYQIKAGEPNSYLDGGHLDQFGGRAPAGAQVFPGFRPANEVNVHRNGYAVYVDLEGDVHRMLRLGVAGRFEDYADFGNTSDYKLTARLAPVQQLVLRAAISTGFRAPSLGQAFFSTVSTNFLAVGGVLLPFEVGTFPVGSPVARALGARPLEPETSDHRSAGVVWTPIPAVELAADYYSVDITDRIVLSGNFTGGQVATLLAPFNVTGARFFTNAIDTATHGYDLRAAYRTSVLGGSLNLTAGYNSTKNEVTRVAPTPPQLAGLQEVLFDATERRRVECGQPRTNLRLAVDWDGGGLFAAARGARYGDYCLVDRFVVPQTFSPKWLADLEVGYRFRRLTLAVGAQNLFDAFPDRNLPANSNLGIFTYPSHSPFGMNGRFVYSRASVRF
ncbi:MAG TPA: TonB-dependent receptor [Thermoanaerobaculia bacterium]|jgi:iron complex outermembrane receptor protein|nr:TonB-dependent receptor [Thermoanaerobaculia bacterium]